MQYFNTTTNPIVGVPNDWSDITGDINANPQLVAQLNDLINKALYFSDLNNLALALDNIIGDDGELYVGGLPTATGTYRLRVEGENLLFERYNGNDWEYKGHFPQS